MAQVMTIQSSRGEEEVHSFSRELAALAGYEVDDGDAGDACYDPIEQLLSGYSVRVTDKPPEMPLPPMLRRMSASFVDTTTTTTTTEMANGSFLHSSMDRASAEMSMIESSLSLASTKAAAVVVKGYPYWMQEGRFKGDGVVCHVKNPNDRELRFANRHCVQFHPSLALFTTRVDYCHNTVHQLPDERRILLYQMAVDTDEAWYFIPETCEVRLFPFSPAVQDPDVASILSRHSAYDAFLNGAEWREKNLTVDHIVALMPDGVSVNYGVLRGCDGTPANLYMDEVLKRRGGDDDNDDDATAASAAADAANIHLWIPQIINSLLVWNETEEGMADLYWKESCEIQHKFFDDDDDDDSDYAIYMFYNCSPSCYDNIYGTAPSNAYAAVIAATFGLVRPTDIVDRGQSLEDYEFDVPTGPAFFVKVDKRTGSILNMPVAEFRRLFSNANVMNWVKNSTAYRIIEHYVIMQRGYESRVLLDIDSSALHEVVYQMTEQYAHITFHDPGYVDLRRVVSTSVDKTHCFGRDTLSGSRVNPLKMDRGFLASAILLVCCSSFAFPVRRPSPLFQLPTRAQFHEWCEADRIYQIADALHLDISTKDVDHSRVVVAATEASVPTKQEHLWEFLENSMVPVPLVDQSSQHSVLTPASEPVLQPQVEPEPIMIRSETTSPETLADLIARTSEHMLVLARWYKASTLPHSDPVYKKKKRDYVTLLNNRAAYRKRYKIYRDVSVTIQPGTFKAPPTRKRSTRDYVVVQKSTKRQKIPEEFEALAKDTDDSIIITPLEEDDEEDNDDDFDMEKALCAPRGCTANPSSDDEDDDELDF